MKYFDVVLTATITETVSVGGRDEDDAIRAALRIVREGYTPNKGLDWDIEEVNIGDALDVAE